MSVNGYVQPGYEQVAEEFARNFSERGELGAAFAATREGRPVVDLWGGVTDSAAQSHWSQDTLQLVFSGTKGLTATCLLMLIDRGKLRLDEPVARYWPEFASAGKSHIRVADVVSHQAGLPGLATPLLVHELTDGERIAARLAAQPPFADERSTKTYHPLTFGWICGELVRRVDGRTLGRFFAQEIAAPLDLDIWIGLPDRNCNRVTTLELSRDWGSEWPGDDELRSDPLLAAIIDNPPSRLNRSTGTPRRSTPARSPPPMRSARRARSPAYTAVSHLAVNSTVTAFYRNRRFSSGESDSTMGSTRSPARRRPSAWDSSCRPRIGSSARQRTRSAIRGWVALVTAPGQALASGSPTQ